MKKSIYENIYNNTGKRQPLIFTKYNKRYNNSLVNLLYTTTPANSPWTDEM